MPNRPAIRLAALARAARIVKARDAGETWAVIAAAHGMTRQRAKQIADWGEGQRRKAQLAPLSPYGSQGYADAVKDSAVTLAAFASRDTLTALAPEPDTSAYLYMNVHLSPKPEG